MMKSWITVKKEISKSVEKTETSAKTITGILPNFITNILSTNTVDISNDPTLDEPSESELMQIMELEEIQSSIEEGYKVLSEQDENAVLVIGKTGAGKSTLVNYLIRPEEIRGIEKVPGRKNKLVIDADERIGYPKIGHGCYAETTIPNKCYDENNCVYWDFPGFGDTYGPVKDIPNAFFIKSVFENATNVKILLLIDYKDLYSRADTIKTLVDNLTKLFVSVDIIKDAVSLIITKVHHGYEVKDVKDDIRDMLSGECFETPSSSKELLQMLLNNGTADEDITGAMIKNKVSLFRKPPKVPGPIGLDNYYEIIEVVNGTNFVPSPPVRVTVSDKSMNYAITMGDGTKKKLVDHFDELRKKIVEFCSIRSASVEGMSLIELNSLVEEIPKIKSTLDVALKCDRVDQLKSSVLAHVDNINNILANRSTSLDVSELSEKIERDSNLLIFLGSINKSVDSICNPFSEIYSRMNDGKSQIEDNLKLITGQVQAKLNSEKDALKALVSSIKKSLLICIKEGNELGNTLSLITKFKKCQEYCDMIKDLKITSTKVTNPDSAFKVIIDTLETELIKKYKLEVPQGAIDNIRIYDTLSLIDADGSSEYKKGFQCELNKMFEDMLKLYWKKVSSIHASFAKNISRIIKDFGDKLDKWLALFKEKEDLKISLEKFLKIVKVVADVKSDPLTITSKLHKDLVDFKVDKSVLSTLDQLSTEIQNINELPKPCDNLEIYPCEKFVKKLTKLLSRLETRYNKLTHDMNILDKFERVMLDFIENIKKYITEANSIVSSIEKLKKVSAAVDLLVNEYKDKKVINGKDFIKSVLKAFQSVDSNLPKQFEFLTEPGVVSSTVITNLTLLNSTLKDDKNWYQSILPEIFLKLNDPNFVEKNDLINLKEITQENFRDFLTKFKKVAEHPNFMFNDAVDEIKFNEDRKEHLHALLNASTLGKMKHEYNGCELSIKGKFIRISEIQHLVNEDVKRIKIKSLGSIFFDDDLKANGVDLFIIVPSWHVKIGKNVSIDLSGKTITKLPRAADGKGYAGNGNGQHGMDGLKGLAGNHGGGFYGSGVDFLGLDKLKINISGGKGQDGQDGGDGACGKAGADATQANKKESVDNITWKALPRENYVSELLFRYYDKTVKFEGLLGGNGGDAGKGGNGGESGEPGIFQVFDQKERTNLELSSNIIKEVGAKGINGDSGHFGEGGKHGNDLEVTYHGVCTPDFDNPRSVTEKRVYVKGSGSNGIVHKTLNKKCSSDHPDEDEACSKCRPVRCDAEYFNKHLKDFLEEYAIYLKKLPQSDFLYKFQQLLLKDFKTELVVDYKTFYILGHHGDLVKSIDKSNAHLETIQPKTVQFTDIQSCLDGISLFNGKHEPGIMKKIKDKINLSNGEKIAVNFVFRSIRQMVEFHNERTEDVNKILINFLDKYQGFAHQNVVAMRLTEVILYAFCSRECRSLVVPENYFLKYFHKKYTSEIQLSAVVANSFVEKDLNGEWEGDVILFILGLLKEKDTKESLEALNKIKSQYKNEGLMKSGGTLWGFSRDEVGNSLYKEVLKWTEYIKKLQGKDHSYNACHKGQTFPESLYPILCQILEGISHLDSSQISPLPLMSINIFNEKHKSETFVKWKDNKEELNEQSKLVLNCFYVSINIVSKCCQASEKIPFDEMVLLKTFDEFSDFISSNFISQRICEALLYWICNVVDKREISNKGSWVKIFESCFLNSKVSTEINLASAYILSYLITVEEIKFEVMEYMTDVLGKPTMQNCKSYCGFRDGEIKKSFETLTSSIRAQGDEQSIIEHLLWYSAVMDEYDYFIKLLENKLNKPKMFSNGETLLTSLLKAKIIKYCYPIIHYAAGKKFLNMANAFKRIPLQVAIEADLYDFISPLLSTCDNLRNEDSDGNTPLKQLFEKLSISTDTSTDQEIIKAIKAIISRGGDIYEPSIGGSAIDYCTRVALKNEIITFQYDERHSTR